MWDQKNQNLNLWLRPSLHYQQFICGRVAANSVVPRAGGASCSRVVGPRQRLRVVLVQKCHDDGGKRQNITSQMTWCGTCFQHFIQKKDKRHTNLPLVWFWMVILKTSCHKNREYAQQTPRGDPVVGSRPNNIRLSPRRRCSSSQPSFICTEPVIKEEKSNDLFKVGSRRVLYHISDLQCTSRAYHLNIAVRINWVSLNPRLSVTKCRLKVRP